MNPNVETVEKSLDEAWYQSFFGEEYFSRHGAELTAERTRSEVDFVLQTLNLPAGAQILDHCCGYGRHSLELARRGYRVVGMDLSEMYLGMAREAAQAEGLEVEFVHSDMRDIDFHEEFDAVVHLFSAFGYLESDADHQRVIDRVAQSLKRGGCFFAELRNHAQILRNFRPRSWQEFSDGTVVLWENRFDALTSILTTSEIIFRDGQTTRVPIAHRRRLYTLTEFAAMLKTSGLALQQVCGDYEGNEHGLCNVSMIVIACKT